MWINKSTVANSNIRTGEHRPCKQCGAVFYAAPWEMKRRRGKLFCSKACSYLGRECTMLFEKGHPPSKPITVDEDSKYRKKAREIVRKIIGAPLGKKIVHHIDEDIRNNEPSNLFIFLHGSAHARWHNYLRRHGKIGLLTSNIPMFIRKYL